MKIQRPGAAKGPKKAKTPKGFRRRKHPKDPKKHMLLLKKRTRRPNFKLSKNPNKNEHMMHRLYVQKIRNHIANAITLTNLALGCASIICSFNDKIIYAIALIGFSGIGDRFDGRVARSMGTESPLGVQLDSMSDAVSFGVAPAMLIYSIFRNVYKGRFMHLVLILVCIFFIICGLFRLARYNISGLDEDGNFYGLPITAAGMFLAFSCLFHKKLSGILYLILMLFLGLLMISRLKIKKQ